MSLFSARCLHGYQLSQVVPLTSALCPWGFIAWAEVFCLVCLGGGQRIVLHGKCLRGDLSAGPTAQG